MKISRRIVAGKICDYLKHRISLDNLVDWAERSMMEDSFDDRDMETIRDIIARLGLADVRAFGLSWEDCGDFLERLGYQVRVIVHKKTVAA
jgi:cobyrinic acid a,c-diamide synthase